MVSFCQQPHSVYLACFTPGDLCCNGMMFNVCASKVLIQWLDAFRFTCTSPMGLNRGSHNFLRIPAQVLQTLYCIIWPVSHNKPTGYFVQEGSGTSKFKGENLQHNKTWFCVYNVILFNCDIRWRIFRVRQHLLTSLSLFSSGYF